MLNRKFSFGPYVEWGETLPQSENNPSHDSCCMTHPRTEMDAPRPDAAPVTTATLFANLCILKSLPQFFFHTNIV